MKKYNTFLFDLDNTLYDEKKYLFQAYKKISKYIYDKYNLDYDLSLSFFKNQYNVKGRKNLFNDFINNFNLSKKELNQFLIILRTTTFKTKITLESYVVEKIYKLLDNQKKIFIVTNGNLTQQKNKVNNIDWRGLDNNMEFIYSVKFGSKPSSTSYLFIKNKYKLIDKEVLMVGDSIVDKQFAKNSGIDFKYANVFFKLN